MTEVMCACCYNWSNRKNMDPEWIKKDALVCNICVADPRSLHEINPDAFYEVGEGQ